MVMRQEKFQLILFVFTKKILKIKFRARRRDRALCNSSTLTTLGSALITKNSTRIVSNSAKVINNSVKTIRGSEGITEGLVPEDSVARIISRSTYRSIDTTLLTRSHPAQ